MPTSVRAQSLTRASSRITLPLASNTTLVLENKNGSESQTALISDSLASTKVVLDSDGSTTATPAYYPYGSPVIPANAGIQEPGSRVTPGMTTNPNNRYYTGQRKVTDVDSPLYNYNARYYSPETGVFTQPDTLEGPNRFSYVAGNPVMKNDPSGHGPAIPPVERLERWYLQKGDRFPNELSFTNDSILIEFAGLNGKKWSSYYSDPALEYLANYYMKRNSFDSKQAPQEFMNSLAWDIRLTSDYNKQLAQHYEKEQMYELNLMIVQSEEMLKGLDKMISETSNRSTFIIDNKPDIERVTREVQEYDTEEKQLYASHNSLSLAQRVSFDQGICSDYALLTAFILAKVGIPATLTASNDIAHAFNLVQVNNKPYVIDTTGGTMQEFYDYNSKKTFAGGFKTWYSNTPWGDPFKGKFDLDRNTPQQPHSSVGNSKGL